MINKKSPIPLYVQLADHLREQIQTGEIKEGDKLPSETEMIKQYKMGRLTIRDALGILVNEGLLEKKQGKGTFCKTNYIHKNQRIDVMLDLSDIHFIPYYLRSICGELETEDINIILSDTKNDVETISVLLEKAIVEEAQGVIFQPPSSSELAPDALVEIINRLIDAKIPYIMIDTAYKNVPASYIIMDDFQAGKIAADYFMRSGHNALCVIQDTKRMDSILRTEGFQTALKGKPYIIENDAELKKSIAKMLAERPDITGMFCYHEEIAKRCYKILNDLGVDIPERLSLISVDDTIIAATLSPPLTTVVHPKEQLGKEAARAMLRLISGDISWPYKKVFEPSLAIRKSCKALLTN